MRLVYSETRIAYVCSSVFVGDNQWVMLCVHKLERKVKGYVILNDNFTGDNGNYTKCKN